MRERISRLANGFIENEVPRAVAQPARIEEELLTEKWSGAFRLDTENHVQMKGLVCSDDPRVTPIKTQFKGYDASIPFQVTVRPDEEEREINGAFTVVGNGFELRVPYHFVLNGGAALRAQARFETPADFARFVQEDREAADRLFRSQSFYDQPLMKDLSVAARYDGLTRRGDIGNALEEFLVSTGAKEAVRFTVYDSARTYQMPHTVFTDTVKIEKNTWGSFTLRVSADADFIVPEKALVTEKDFDGDTCLLPYQICTDRLHPGVNRGHIRIEGTYQSFEVGLSCALSTYQPESNQEQLEFQRALTEFTRLHLLYLAGTRTSAEDLEQLQGLIGKLRGAQPSEIRFQLIHAHLYVLQRKAELASMLLNDLYGPVYERRESRPDLYCYYLYIRYLLEGQPEQKELLTELLSQFRQDGAGGALMFLVRLAAEQRLQEDSVYFLQEIRREYDNGERSPYLYMALCLKYRRLPELLTMMDDLSLQALSWGSENGLVGLSLARQTASLAASERGYRPGYVRLLKRLYQTFGQSEVLAAVCTLLMKGDIQTPDSFSWYEKGVKSDLRLTRLYEYYLCTRPENCSEPLSAPLLGYFAYQHSLGVKAKTALYRYILSHYQPGDREYDAYRGQMEQFVMGEVLHGNVDDRLAYLYQRLLYPEMVDEKVAGILPMILHTHMVVTAEKQMTQAVLRYEESTEETSAPLRGGRAFLPIYGDHYVLMLQDANGNRYTGFHTDVVPLMEKEPLLSACRAYRPPHKEEGFSECRALYEAGDYTRQGIDLFRETVLNPALSRPFREKLSAAVIRWIHDSKDELIFDKDYLNMDASQMKPAERGLWIESLIDRGYYADAWAQIPAYGYRRLDEERLLALASAEAEAGTRGDLLSEIAAWLFAKGKTKPPLLSLLCGTLQSDTDRMLQVWDAAREAGADTGDMEERLLAQMLFTGRYDRAGDVFTAYAEKGTVDGMLVRAYFTVLCYRYFLEDRDLGEDNVAYIEQHDRKETRVGDLPVIHRLALTKYYYGAFILTDDQMEFGRELVQSILDDGLVFEYLKPLSRKLGMQIKLQNRQIIEYRAGKNDQLQLRYRVLPDQTEFAEETFRHMYEGIFVKTLTAFEGDTVEYDICRRTADPDAREVLYQGSFFVSSEEAAAPYGRMGQMNQLLRLAQSGDEMALKRAMEDYGVRETMTKAWFPLKK